MSYSPLRRSFHAPSPEIGTRLGTVFRSQTADIIMLKCIRVGVLRAYKIGILNHGEEETFGDGAQDSVVYRQGF